MLPGVDDRRGRAGRGRLGGDRATCPPRTIVMGTPGQAVARRAGRTAAREPGLGGRLSPRRRTSQESDDERDAHEDHDDRCRCSTSRRSTPTIRADIDAAVHRVHGERALHRRPRGERRSRRRSRATRSAPHAVALRVGHRRAAARAVGARHRPRRRGHHQRLLVLRQRRHRSPTTARRRCSWTSTRAPTTSTRTGSRPRSRRAPRR